MEARSRIRFLAGKTEHRPALVAFTSELAARLEQVPPDTLARDANTLTRALLRVQDLCMLDTVVLEVPLDAVDRGSLDVIQESLKRLRILLDDRAGVVLALPGLKMLAQRRGLSATPRTIEDLGAEVLVAITRLEPQNADCLAVVEAVALEDDELGPLDDALTPVWNTARFYAIPSLLVVAHAGPAVGATGADALAVWEGASALELIAAGARRIGVPLAAGSDPASSPLPPQGFYSTAGSLPEDTDLDWLRATVATSRAL